VGAEDPLLAFFLLLGSRGKIPSYVHQYALTSRYGWGQTLKDAKPAEVSERALKFFDGLCARHKVFGSTSFSLLTKTAHGADVWMGEGFRRLSNFWMDRQAKRVRVRR
jgi:hypothetical protein